MKVVEDTSNSLVCKKDYERESTFIRESLINRLGEDGQERPEKLLNPDEGGYGIVISVDGKNMSFSSEAKLYRLTLIFKGVISDNDNNPLPKWTREIIGSFVEFG